jgi:hypothetical protein
MNRALLVGVSMAAAFVLARPAVVGAEQAQAAPAAPLAPDKYKNIQVLTDVPADRFLSAMDYIAASTGFACTDCHVQDAATAWAPEKDDKRTKQRAREMIKMVKGINAADFGVVVGCATCHQGRNRPAPLQVAHPTAFDDGIQAPAGSAAAGGTARQAPSADDIVARYVEALGGRAALERVKSRVMTGTATTRTGRSLHITIEQRSNAYRETAGAAPAAQVIRGFDGTVAWMNAGGQTTDLLVFEQTVRVSDVVLALGLKDRYRTLQPAPPTRIDNRDVNVLRGGADGVTEMLYFDASSGLLVRRAITTPTPLGPLPWQVEYADYRDVAGVKMPFQITRSNWTASDTLTFAEITTNVEIDGARFARPAA